ncbi:MAG: hypothetical protein M3Y65_09570 [Pseudomonadota bacterium]|nr:hypothetical protein [Pseudomonadota bacterium]
MLRYLSWTVALVLLSGSATAQANSPPAPEALTPAPEALMLTPAQKARLAPRRPTRQIVGSPLPLPIVTEGYRPTLTARPASGAPDPVGTLPIHPTPSNAAPLMPMPVPIVNCIAGSCSGPDGVRYNAGAAGVTVDPAGRTCHTMGATVQCF